MKRTSKLLSLLLAVILVLGVLPMGALAFDLPGLPQEVPIGGGGLPGTVPGLPGDDLPQVVPGMGPGLFDIQDPDTEEIICTSAEERGMYDSPDGVERTVYVSAALPSGSYAAEYGFLLYVADSVASMSLALPNASNEQPVFDAENNEAEEGWWILPSAECAPADYGMVEELCYGYYWLDDMLETFEKADFVLCLYGEMTDSTSFALIIPVGGGSAAAGNLYTPEISYSYDALEVSLAFGGVEGLFNNISMCCRTGVEEYDVTILGCPEGSEVWYTLDYSDPTTSDTAALYTGPIHLTESTMIMAVIKTDDDYGKIWYFPYVCAGITGVSIYPDFYRAVEPYYAQFICYDNPEMDITYYYTLDESDPRTSETRIEYTEPFLISDTATIRYYGVSADGKKSEVMESGVFFYESLFSYELAGEDAQRCVVTATRPENDSEYWGRRTFDRYIAVPYGQTSFDIIGHVDPSATVTLNGVAQTVDAEGNCPMTLVAKNETTGEYDLGNTYEYGENTVVVQKGSKRETWKLYGASALFDDFPDKVVDYFCPGSQYTNNPYGKGGEKTLIGGTFTVGTDNVFSVGNLGGYITYYYEDAIYDDPNAPFGVDFIVYGNSFSSGTWQESANVLVSEDGETWYNLAGSHHYADNTEWLKGVVCSNKNGYSFYTFPNGSSTLLPVPYPLKSFYPLHFSIAENAGDWSSFTFDAVRLTAPESAFGYADTGDLTESNEAANPYIKGGARTGDAMDLAWAVDENGQPVTFPNGIHYIKVQNATIIDAGVFGEYSAELCMVRRAAKADAAVGKTDAPAGIKVDGKPVALEAGKYIYDAAVNGLFAVEVEAGADANVYVNEFSGASHIFETAPTHGIIRIIVQEGEKEPVIYYLNLTESGDEPEATATLTMNAGEGRFPDEYGWNVKQITLPFDGNMSNIALPDPDLVNKPTGKVFDGWYGGMHRYATYPAEVADMTLTARWVDAPADAPADETVTVTFRLIGSTLSEGDIDLADGDYKGAEYVTWIPTKTYTLPAGSVVRDVFYEAVYGAGLKQEGAEKGYVSAIWAPESLGGYKLAEFTNGPRSGWMYTMNGEHTNAIEAQTMPDGAEIVFHYVNDYAWEVEDWAKLGGTQWPQLSTEQNNYWNAWLAAPDVAPPESAPEGGSGSGTTDKDKDKDEKQTVFEDVPADAYYADAVAWAVEKGITDGVTETEFKPESTCNRGQIVTFLWRAAGSPKPTSTNNPFADVKESDYFYEAVLWAVANGVTDGVDATHFAPARPCTREQAVTFMWRAAGSEQVSGGEPFADVDAGDYSAAAVAWAVANEITDGVSETRFAPENECTRGQIVTFLYREYGEQ